MSGPEGLHLSSQTPHEFVKGVRALQQISILKEVYWRALMELSVATNVTIESFFERHPSLKPVVDSDNSFPHELSYDTKSTSFGQILPGGFAGSSHVAIAAFLRRSWAESAPNILFLDPLHFVEALHRSSPEDKVVWITSAAVFNGEKVVPIDFDRPVPIHLICGITNLIPEDTAILAERPHLMLLNDVSVENFCKDKRVWRDFCSSEAVLQHRDSIPPPLGFSVDVNLQDTSSIESAVKKIKTIQTATKASRFVVKPAHLAQGVGVNFLRVLKRPRKLKVRAIRKL